MIVCIFEHVQCRWAERLAHGLEVPTSPVKGRASLPLTVMLFAADVAQAGTRTMTSNSPDPCT
jgi:hypothetical protein